MKTILFYALFVFSSINAFCQDYEISKYESDYKESDLEKAFRLDGNEIFISDGKTRFIEFKNNELTCYRIKSGKILSKQKIGVEKESYYKNFIDSLLALNPKDLTIDLNEKGENLKIEDGALFEINLFKNGKRLNLKSYSPYEYINFKCINYQKRAIFLNAYKNLFSLFYNETFEKTRITDTLFINFNIDYLFKKASSHIQK